MTDDSHLSPDVTAGQGLTYGIDLVLCIDGTASMKPVIEDVKSKALKLPDDLLRAMVAKDKHVTALRLKLVIYRDIFVDAEPFRVSEFFRLPEDRGPFEAFIREVSAQGGGDEPESGLEALGIALNADWSNEHDRRRHVIVVWTDASAHPLEKGAGAVPGAYASQIPSTLDELTDLWEGGQKSAISVSSRRLVLFTPEATPWTDLNDNWPEVIHFPSRAGEGLAEFEYDEILDLLAQSVA